MPHKNVVILDRLNILSPVKAYPNLVDSVKFSQTLLKP